jgi:SAM-dependent methyltransferase
MPIPTILLADYQFDSTSLDEINRLGFRIASSSQVKSPFGPTVTLLELQPPPAPLKTINLKRQTFCRYMDRYFLPRPPDPAIVTALCNHIALQYNREIDSERNISNIVSLLRRAVEQIPHQTGYPLRILDFGCGTGLSVQALSRLSAGQSNHIELIGTDASPAMLEQAHRNGLRVITMDAWWNTSPRSFDAVIASFLFHFGITDDEARALATQVRPPGIIVGNYHKGKPLQIARLSEQFASASLSATVWYDEPDNPVVLFSLNR